MTKSSISRTWYTVNLSGRNFGKLLVIGKADPVKATCGRNITIWKCVCECGKIVECRHGNLTSGSTRSCGCLKSEVTRQRSIKHGGTVNRRQTPEYYTWHGMIARCHTPQSSSYNRYGARGIKVCERWRNFEMFHLDMGNRPGSEYSIDRIDPNGDYSPENCRWATSKEQARNTRSNMNLSHNGKTQCVSAWAEEIGLKPATLLERINRGWSVEESLTTPVWRPGTVRRSCNVSPKNHLQFTIDGRKRSLSEWSRENGISPKAVWQRLKAGWDIERALRTPLMAKKRNKRYAETA